MKANRPDEQEFDKYMYQSFVSTLKGLQTLGYIVAIAVIEVGIYSGEPSGPVAGLVVGLVIAFLVYISSPGDSWP
ncbi:hypothetical protein [Gloeobacter violaceus]|uniref:hypothetical protein n=1 Tax=Gloeobacter violaceus TaxID=33072 RepID=UPI0013E8E069|nr:hypothetical protein [Gloeobacter violaceus]